MLSYDLGFMPRDSLRDGVSDRVMREMCRFASVPAGFPEPYLYDRFTSGSEDRVGLG
jgi:hypothetical protein